MINFTQELEGYFDRLWPITRSLTGNGNRESLKILQELIPLELHEVASGTACLDWNVPPEWNIRDAYVKDSSGEKVIDYQENNLHILGYSAPFQGKLNLRELKEHLYTMPDHPDWIPYLTSYYKERWGFCLTHRALNELKEDTYEIYIDSSLNQDGHMTYGDLILPGSTSKEVLFSTYICHPSMANNELSGPLVTAFIYKALKNIQNRKYTYRFVFIPETIGSIYYLSKHGSSLKEELEAGFVVTCIGDSGKFTYKQSRAENSLTNRAAIASLNGQEHVVEAFFPLGSDERQYCSPGFNLPVGSLMRTRYHQYPEYHTSADDKSFISFEAMQGSVEQYMKTIRLLEKNAFYVNTSPLGEPQLGKRGLYPSLGSQRDQKEKVESMMWALNYSDGNHDLIDIVKRSGLDSDSICDAVEKLLEHGLLKIQLNEHE